MYGQILIVTLWPAHAVAEDFAAAKDEKQREQSRGAMASLCHPSVRASPALRALLREPLRSRGMI